MNSLIQSLIGKHTEPVQCAAPISKLCEDPCAEQLIREGGYCKLLFEREQNGWESDAIQAASAAMQREMAYVPAGTTRLQPILSGESSSFAELEMEDEAFFIDRYTVTNAQFERFVNGDGYRKPELWPEDIFALLFQFVDETGQPGPAGWQQGSPPQDRRDHPVTGVCWYEASAYAAWVGKHLPTSSQWQRAGTWWKPNVRHPWGNSFQRSRAHTGLTPQASTAPVDAFPDGATPNGIHQLIGNVWEWTDTALEQIEHDGQMYDIPETFGEIRGGAYDTYLVSQSNCLFRSGLPLLYRGPNVGFRCCVSPDCLDVENDVASP